MRFFFAHMWFHFTSDVLMGTYEIFSCTYLMQLHIWRYNMHITDFLLYIWPSDYIWRAYIWFWENHIPCQVFIISGNAIVYLNTLSFCYILVLMASVKPFLKLLVNFFGEVENLIFWEKSRFFILNIFINFYLFIIFLVTFRGIWNTHGAYVG